MLYAHLKFFPSPDGVNYIISVYPEKNHNRLKKDDWRSYDDRLRRSLSRTKNKVFELAVCNSWDWFCTFTFSEKKANRFSYDDCKNKLTQFFKDYKKRKSSDFKYLVVAEPHEDGAIHFHGLCSGFKTGDLYVPDFIVKDGVLVPNTKGYYRFNSYHYGFFSCSSVKSHFAVSKYVTKYITKDFLTSSIFEKGAQICLHSKGLRQYTDGGFITIPEGFSEGQNKLLLLQSISSDVYHTDFCSQYSGTLDEFSESVFKSLNFGGVE